MKNANLTVESKILGTLGIAKIVAEFIGIPNYNLAEIRGKEEVAGCYGNREELIQDKKRFLDPDLRVVKIYRGGFPTNKFKIEIKTNTYKGLAYFSEKKNSIK